MLKNSDHITNWYHTDGLHVKKCQDQNSRVKEMPIFSICSLLAHVVFFYIKNKVCPLLVCAPSGESSRCDLWDHLFIISLFYVPCCDIDGKFSHQYPVTVRNAMLHTWLRMCCQMTYRHRTFQNEVRQRKTGISCNEKWVKWAIVKMLMALMLFEMHSVQNVLNWCPTT